MGCGRSKIAAENVDLTHKGKVVAPTMRLKTASVTDAEINFRNKCASSNDVEVLNRQWHVKHNVTLLKPEKNKAHSMSKEGCELKDAEKVVLLLY